MNTYAAPQPIDRNENTMQGYPTPEPALTQYLRENATTSSVMTLTDDTTVIEIAAGGGPAIMKWITTADTSGSVFGSVLGVNYDHVIPKDTLRRFVVPIERIGVSSIVGYNKQNGLYNRVAVRSMGIASVLTSEYR